MAACTFFGHRDCYSLDEQALMDAIEDLIRKGVDTFYIGNQGQFDSAVYAYGLLTDRNPPPITTSYSSPHFSTPYS